jgi:hypothetical protein
LRCIKPYWTAGGSVAEDKNTLDLAHIAEIIAKYAYKLSLDPTYNSPFAKKAV